MTASSRLFRRSIAALAVTGVLVGLPAIAGAADNNGTPVPPATVLGPSTTAASDSHIAVFFDPAYVDTSTGGAGEAYNVQQALISGGYTVTTFTGTSTAAWTAALTGVQAVAVPELEVDQTLGADLDPGALTALQSFLSGGGELMTFSQRDWAFMDTVLGLADGTLDGNESCPCTKTAAATGTVWASGPATLGSNDDTNTLDVSTAPVGTLNVYADDSLPGDAGLAAIPVGEGGIVYFAWDWFFESEQDLNWITVLNEAAAGLPPLAPPVTPVTPEPPIAPAPLPASPRFTG
jgi:hypothetical protein